MRKRSRETDGDMGEEFFPLSKRINSLQISGEFTFLPNTVQHPVNHCHLSIPSQPQHQSSTSVLQQDPPYNPELNLEQNPFYFNQNKHLYELYRERQLRLGKQPYV
jgi:hypothetical protein